MIKLIGVPYDDNSTFAKGPALAPPKIRQMDVGSAANRFSELGVAICEGENYRDLGDIDFSGLSREEVYKKIKATIAQELTNDDKIISLGGDHSVSFPLIEAYAQQYQNLHVLHLDAHADLYDDFEGNPFSHASPFARLMEKYILGSLTQVGIRTLTTHQQEQAAKFDVNIIEMKDFSFDFIAQLKGPLYISLDLDVLDPAYAPGISHHEPGGMNTRQLISIIQQIKVPIVGADIVELNPTRDLNDAAAMVAYKLFKEIAYKMLD
jgi:agmatinase